MQIKDVKDLQKVIRLMRSEGVDKMKIDNVEIELGLAPQKPQRKSTASNQTAPLGAIDEDTKIEIEGELSPEDLLFYSATSQTPIA